MNKKKYLILFSVILLFGCANSNLQKQPSNTNSELINESNFPNDIKNEFVVTFDSDGGTIIPSITVKEGELVSKPNDPIKIDSKYDYKFIGWYLDDLLWDFEKDKVTKNITLKAVYKKTNEYPIEF